jgi:hypothetical protein
MLRWQRSVTMPALVALFCGYVIIIERAFAAPVSGGA